MASRARYFPEGWKSGTSDPREPCLLVKLVTEREKRQPGTTAPLPLPTGDVGDDLVQGSVPLVRGPKPGRRPGGGRRGWFSCTSITQSGSIPAAVAAVQIRALIA
jgi:hypothetical protein